MSSFKLTRQLIPHFENGELDEKVSTQERVTLDNSPKREHEQK